MFKVWKSASILVVLALVLSLGLVMAPLAGTAGAATIRVPEDYTYIQDAIYAASAGDTILVSPGEYGENLQIYSGKTNRDGLTIKSTDGAEVTIIIGGDVRAGMAAQPPGAPTVNIYDVNGVTFQGFTVVEGTSFSWYEIPLPGFGISLINASNCLIANNIVVDNEAGILVLGGTVYPMLLLAGGDGVGADGGIELVSNGNTIRNNEVCENGGGTDGLEGVGADGMMGTGFGILLINCQDTTVKGNEVYENEAGGIGVMGGNMSMGDDMAGGEMALLPRWDLMGVARDNRIIDNEIYDNGIDGVPSPGMVGQPIWIIPTGVLLWNAIQNTVSGNEIYENPINVLIAGMTADTPWGIYQGEANGNVVSDNTIYHSEVSVVILGYSFMPLMLGDLFGGAVGKIDGGTCASDNEVTDNTIEENGNGVIVAGANNTRISRNDIRDNGFGVIISGNMGVAGMVGALSGEPLGNDVGIYASDNEVTDNTIEENGEGVIVDNASNTRILRNDIINNNGGNTGIYVDSYSYGTEVHFNNIKGNSYSEKVTQGVSVVPASYGVWNSGDNPLLDATFNWWGEDDESGPYCPGHPGVTHEVCPCTNDPASEVNTDGTGDRVSSNIDYCPWLLERFRPATSASSTTGEGEVGYNTSNWDSAIIQKLEAKDPSEVGCPPKPEMFFPYGIFSFTVLLKNIGGTATITITLPEDMPIGTQYWKCQNGEWVNVNLGDDDGDNVLTLTLTDGGLGDADGVADGVIVDPGGPGIPIPLSTEKKAAESADLSASYLQISPPQVNPNQPVTISINVANTGGEGGSHAVTLYINGNAEQSKTVTVSPGSSQNVAFTVSKATRGTYAVLLEGQSGQFTVKSTTALGGGGLGTGGIIAIVLVVIAIIVGLIFVMRGTPGKA
jgi:parallel beta-helix repeat protein